MPITTNEHETTEALGCLMSWSEWENVLTEFFDDVVEASEPVVTHILIGE